MTLNCSISRKVTASLALIGLFLSTSTALVPCKADEVTADAIVAALRGPKTRSLVKPRPEAATDFARLREIRKTRGLTLQEREALTVAARELQIDLRILFNFDSDKVQPSGMKTLDEVAKALKSRDLRGKSFVIAGHTDRKGARTTTSISHYGEPTQ